MGYWGFKPWENDYTADWLVEVFDKSKLSELIEQSLKKEVDDYTRDEIRGAIMLVILLGRSLVYPEENLRAHIDLAISKSQELKQHWLEGGWDHKPEIESELEFELTVLKYRKKNLERTIEEQVEPPASVAEKWTIEWV